MRTVVVFCPNDTQFLEYLSIYALQEHKKLAFHYKKKLQNDQHRILLHIFLKYFFQFVINNKSKLNELFKNRPRFVGEAEAKLATLCHAD